MYKYLENERVLDLSPLSRALSLYLHNLGLVSSHSKTEQHGLYSLCPVRYCCTCAVQTLLQAHRRQISRSAVPSNSYAIVQASRQAHQRQISRDAVPSNSYAMKRCMHSPNFASSTPKTDQQGCCPSIPYAIEHVRIKSRLKQIESK